MKSAPNKTDISQELIKRLTGIIINNWAAMTEGRFIFL
ncbi:hypothetical protein CU015_1392 [Enterococcus faecium]|nr:hypothetical protein [Enterococcus faecium]